MNKPLNFSLTFHREKTYSFRSLKYVSTSATDPECCFELFNLWFINIFANIPWFKLCLISLWTHTSSPKTVCKPNISESYRGHQSVKAHNSIYPFQSICSSIEHFCLEPIFHHLLRYTGCPQIHLKILKYSKISNNRSKKVFWI